MFEDILKAIIFKNTTTLFSFRNMLGMFQTSKHVPKTEKRCCVFKDNCFICANKTILKAELKICEIG